MAYANRHVPYHSSTFDIGEIMYTTYSAHHLLHMYILEVVVVKG
jgi:hypothetical protein